MTSADVALWIHILRRVCDEVNVAESDAVAMVETRIVRLGESRLTALQSVAETLYMERIFPKRQEAFKDWTETNAN